MLYFYLTSRERILGLRKYLRPFAYVVKIALVNRWLLYWRLFFTKGATYVFRTI